jgi:hypothetical protein
MKTSSKRHGVEVADIMRHDIKQYLTQYKMPPAHYKVVADIINCRTSYLGGHVERCDHCQFERISYNSCRNRHCPKCQCLSKERWLKARGAELLPTRYFHAVFTLPHDLNPVILSNKAKMLNMLFKAVSDTLLTFGRNPDNGLSGQLGIIAVLHTWDQKLRDHFHLHCLIPAGALGKDHWTHCRNDFLFPVKALSIVLRKKYMDLFARAYRQNALIFPGKTKKIAALSGYRQLVDRCYLNKWVVDIREPIASPEHVLDYLGRYTHRVAISNNRIVSMENGKVSFTYKDRKAGQTKIECIEAVEFIRRFLLHVLPKRFMKVRHYGFLANRNKKQNVQRCRRLLGLSSQMPPVVDESIQEVMLRLTGTDIYQCTHCKKGKMTVIKKIRKGTGESAYSIVHPP